MDETTHINLKDVESNVPLCIKLRLNKYIALQYEDCLSHHAAASTSTSESQYIASCNLLLTSS